MPLRMNNGRKEPINLHGSQRGCSPFSPPPQPGSMEFPLLIHSFFVGPDNQTYTIEIRQSVCESSRCADRGRSSVERGQPRQIITRGVTGKIWMLISKTLKRSLLEFLLGRSALDSQWNAAWKHCSLSGTAQSRRLRWHSRTSHCFLASREF